MSIFGHKSRRQREWEEVQTQARDDLVALGEDIRSLDVDIEMPDVKADAKQRYQQAVEAYQDAEQALEHAGRPDDLGRVTSSLEEGRYAMTCAQALLEGREPPERRAPCFFDPRHGPSTEDVDWAPPGGQSRPVPACAADAIRVKEGFDPHGRQVLVNGRPTEYWNAPGHFAPWAGGYFGGMGGGGLLPGLLAGSLLGGALGLGVGGLGGIFGDDGGDGGDWGGGDFGGGGDFDGGGFDF
jgi:hypothetical protein